MSSKFDRFREGVGVYAASPLGQLEVKIVFLLFVVVGLFGGGVERFVSGDKWLALALVGFGFISLNDLNVTWRAKKLMKKNMEDGLNV